mgnify:CR=1 FL=1
MDQIDSGRSLTAKAIKASVVIQLLTKLSRVSDMLQASPWTPLFS